jgi:hypothetical protein
LITVVLLEGAWVGTVKDLSDDGAGIGRSVLLFAEPRGRVIQEEIVSFERWHRVAGEFFLDGLLAAGRFFLLPAGRFLLLRKKRQNRKIKKQTI